jgi:hypothetical protein
MLAIDDLTIQPASYILLLPASPQPLCCARALLCLLPALIFFPIQSFTSGHIFFFLSVFLRVGFNDIDVSYCYPCRSFHFATAVQ